MPSGITLNASTGVLSGTPTATASLQVGIRVTDSTSPQQADDAIFNMTVYTPAQSNALEPYSFSITSGTATGYDAVGNVVAYTDSVNGTWSMTTSSGASGYDSLNRLTAAQATAGGYQGLQMAWSYDSFGNRTAETVSGGSGALYAIPASTSASFDANNRLLAVSGSGSPYDAAGNLTCPGRQFNASGNCLGDQYLYDGEGRVCAVYDSTSGGSTQYLYDAEGARVAKGTISQWSCDTDTNGFQPTLAYVLSPSGEQLSEIQNANGAWQWLRTNVYAAGQQIATYSATTGGALSFHMSDWLGTRRQTTDFAGNPCATYAGLPFGNGVNAATAPCLTPTEAFPDHYFTGKERDAESGNDYFGARYYASSMGRFMSPDWSAKAQPVPYAKMDNPQTLNLYAYMRNNPLGGTDPDGHCDWCQRVWNKITGNGWQTNAQVAANRATVTTSQTMTLTLPATAAVAGIAGPPFANQLPSLLPQELSTMNGMGVTPLSPGSPGFTAAAEQAGGQINWTLSANGELLTTPALEGVTHAATAGGADVLGAGTAQVAGSGSQTMIFDITAQSGHYMNGASAAQSEAATAAGAGGFAAFFESVFVSIPIVAVIPQNILHPYGGGGCPPGGC